MEDPWKYPAFVGAGIAAFVTAEQTGPQIAELMSLEIWLGEYIAAGFTGVVLGFLIDEMLPVYIDDIRSGSSGGSSMSGGGGDDFDMDGDIDI